MEGEFGTEGSEVLVWVSHDVGWDVFGVGFDEEGGGFGVSGEGVGEEDGAFGEWVVEPEECGVEVIWVFDVGALGAESEEGVFEDLGGVEVGFEDEEVFFC